MDLSWFAEFFQTLPAALRELYLFGDPSGEGRGWLGFAIALLWGIGFTAIPLAIAWLTHGKREWVSATMGVIAGSSIFWWIFGILPSAWLNYVNSSSELLEGAIIPESASITFAGGYTIAIAADLYSVIRDLVVVIEHAVALGLVFFAVIKIQQRFPRALAAGETRAESGGYK